MIITPIQNVVNHREILLFVNVYFATPDSTELPVVGHLTTKYFFSKLLHNRRNVLAATVVTELFCPLYELFCILYCSVNNRKYALALFSIVHCNRNCNTENKIISR